MVRIPDPIYTLRGHTSGVTALYMYNGPDGQYLISGDEDGNIKFWCTGLFKYFSHVDKACPSRIQSVYVIFLNMMCHDRIRRRDFGNLREEDVLVIHSRDHGVYLLNFDNALYNTDGIVLQQYPSYPSLFCRGASFTIEGHRALLAYPSESEGHVVTVRMLGDDAKTIATVEARRPAAKNLLFDIILRRLDNRISLYTAYEDGNVCHYSLDIDLAEANREHNKLGVQLLRTIDTGAKDFVSVIDVNSEYLVAGTPQKEIFFSEDLTDAKQKLDRVPLKRRGVSTISIRPDEKYFAVACWDNSVYLYSMTSLQIMGTTRFHNEQVSQILFARKRCFSGVSEVRGKYLMFCASLDGNISVTAIY